MIYGYTDNPDLRIVFKDNPYIRVIRISVFFMWYSKKPIIALAPMADMTDSPFCQICREIGGKEFVIFREMVSAEAIIRGNEKTLKMCAFDKIERPIVIQIFGSRARNMAEAAKIVVDKFYPDGLDVNMGCPVPKITGKNRAGAALIKDSGRAAEIIRALKQANLGVPISVKTRLGWSRDDEILSFAKILEEAGADALTIHGRTKTQGYAGEANWERIGEVKSIVSIPIIANGDINSAEDARECLRITGADGVMIGRGALGNPWIFGEVERLKVKGERPTRQLARVVLRHAELHVERYGERGMVTFRKHLAHYFRGVKFEGTKNPKELRINLVKVKTMEDLRMILQVGA